MEKDEITRWHGDSGRPKCAPDPLLQEAKQHHRLPPPSQTLLHLLLQVTPYHSAISLSTHQHLSAATMAQHRQKRTSSGAIPVPGQRLVPRHRYGRLAPLPRELTTSPRRRICLLDCTCAKPPHTTQSSSQRPSS